MISTAINHMDALLRNGKEDTWHDDPWPRLSGSDFAGIVRRCGPGVTRLRIGASVVGHTRTGVHASHIGDSGDATQRPSPQLCGECSQPAMTRAWSACTA